MEISELKVGQGKVDIDLTVKSKEDVRTFNKYGKDLRVCNLIAIDVTNTEIKVTLWNDEVDKVNVGDKIRITNGYVSEFNGQKQLTSGKFGKLEVLSSDSSKAKTMSENVGKASKSKKKVKEESEEDVQEEEADEAKESDPEEDAYF